MIVTVADIVNANSGLNKLAITKFNGKQAFVIARILKQVEEEYDIFNQTRTNLINKYAEQENGQVIVDESGNVKIKPENIQAFNEEFSALLETEIEIDCNPIPIDWLDQVTMTPNEIQSLVNFIEM